MLFPLFFCLCCLLSTRAAVVTNCMDGYNAIDFTVANQTLLLLAFGGPAEITVFHLDNSANLIKTELFDTPEPANGLRYRLVMAAVNGIGYYTGLETRTNDLERRKVNATFTIHTPSGQEFEDDPILVGIRTSTWELLRNTAVVFSGNDINSTRLATVDSSWLFYGDNPGNNLVRNSYEFGSLSPVPLAAPGRFVVSGTRRQYSDSQSYIYLATFDETGEHEVQFQSWPNLHYSSPIAFHDGKFALIWRECQSAWPQEPCYPPNAWLFQLFAADGNRIGTWLRLADVLDTFAQTYTRPQVAVLSNDTFVALWRRGIPDRNGQVNAFESVIRVFSQRGEPLGPIHQVSPVTLNDYDQPISTGDVFLGILPGDEVVVAFERSDPTTPMSSYCVKIFKNDSQNGTGPDTGTAPDEDNSQFSKASRPGTGTAPDEDNSQFSKASSTLIASVTLGFCAILLHMVF